MNALCAVSLARDKVPGAAFLVDDLPKSGVGKGRKVAIAARLDPLQPGSQNTKRRGKWPSSWIVGR